jgi:hypothetical protein
LSSSSSSSLKSESESTGLRDLGACDADAAADRGFGIGDDM